MNQPVSQKIERCRICGDEELELVLDLGAQPPANSLHKEGQGLPSLVPLVLCRCQRCSTLQLTESVSPVYLFSNYVWLTGTSDSAKNYSRVFHDRVMAFLSGRKPFVLEVASNDGTFLKRFQESGARVLGVDPARNVAAIASESGIPTIAEFFGMTIARQIVQEHGHADAVIARNVIPHVSNVQDVLEGIRHCLTDDGIGVVEIHRADVILEELHYDSIYHEHLYYHSLHSISRLLAQHGLTVFDVSSSPISGGSLVVYCSRTNRSSSVAMDDAMERERLLGITISAPWHEFARRCGRHRDELRALISRHRNEGKRVIGYGASARSSTLLNYCGIDRMDVEAIADGNVLKQGWNTPGSNIPIVSPQHAFARRPATVLLLAWNLREEIMAKMTTELGWHGDVIIPLPNSPKVVQI